MKKIFLLLILAGSTLITRAQSSITYKTISDLIPEGWKAIDTIFGDLNKDGANDIVLVIENTSKENFKSNEGGLGDSILNLNPRRLIISFKKDDGYQTILTNDSFVPSKNSEDVPCLEDPYARTAIKNGTLQIDFYYFMNCGSWYVTNKTFIFRYQNKNFELIGFDESSFHRGTHSSQEVSINYLTRKKQTKTAASEEAKPKQKWETITVKELQTLNNINPAEFSEL